MCRWVIRALAFILLGLSVSCIAVAQSEPRNQTATTVPRVVKFSGMLKDSSNNPLSGTQNVRFAIYGDATGGTSLWEETQNVQFVNGRYTVFLGVTTNEGIPGEVFSANQSRWLGVRFLSPGEDEQPRVFLTSVPYALKAADADTLGGLPASAYVRTDGNSQAQPSSSGATPAVVTSPGSPVRGTSLGVTTPGGVSGQVPVFSGTSTIVDSDIQDVGGLVKMPELQVANINNIIFVDGVINKTLANALAGCAASGCTIDMRGNSSSPALALGTFDPGPLAVTLLLGPYRYTARQITLRTNLQIIGYGSGTVSGGQGTQIVSNSTTNQPLFVIPQGNHVPAQFVRLRNFELLGAPGNTSQDCFFLDASALHDAGMRYSILEQLQITGFKGVALHLRGTPNTFSGLNEWDQFRQLIVYRPAGGLGDIVIEGANGQLEFIGGQYDGPGQGQGTNIYIGTYQGGLALPLDVSFHKVTSQLADVGVQVNGCRMCEFQMHHEAINGVYLLTHTGTDASGDMVVIQNTQFDNGSGVNGGNGYLVNVMTSLVNVSFDHNAIAGIPDHVIQGTNGMSFSAKDNMFNTLPTNVYASSGVAFQINPAATIGIGRSHLVRLNPSPTCVQTLQSALGAGEMVTFRALGSVCFNTGGNMEFGNYKLPLNLALGQTATFVRNDADINFTLIGTSIAPGSAAAVVPVVPPGLRDSTVAAAIPSPREPSAAPTIASGFGADASIVAKETSAFMINVGTHPAGTGTIALPEAAMGWNCSAFDVTNPLKGGGYYVKQTAGTKTSATLWGFNSSGAPDRWAAEDVLRVSCFAF